MISAEAGIAKAKDGAEIYYESRGDGPAILAIGGAGSGALSFTKIAAPISNRYHFVSYDRRGTIRSTGRPEHDMDMAQQADDIVSVLEHSGVSSAILFASCGGASIAFDFITRFPQYVAGIVAHEPISVALLPDAQEQIDFYKHICETNEREGPIPALRIFMNYLGRELTTSFHDRMKIDGDYIWRHEAMPMVKYMPDLEQIKELNVPLVMAAGVDSISNGYGYARTAPLLAYELDCKVSIFRGHHTSYAYHPEDFARQLSDCADYINKQDT